MCRVTIFALVATAAFCFASAVPQNPFWPPQRLCGINEAAYPCGRRCEKICNEELPEFCKGIQCEGFACRCKNGFARNPIIDICIPVKDCPAKKCNKGEVGDVCGRICERTCANRSPPAICQLIDCNPLAEKQCRCNYEAGYLRSEKTGRCVLPNHC